MIGTDGIKRTESTLEPFARQSLRQGTAFVEGYLVFSREPFVSFVFAGASGVIKKPVRDQRINFPDVVVTGVDAMLEGTEFH